MAAQTVTFLNGVSKSWARTLLANLFKKNSYISVLPYNAQSGVTWNDLSFQGADEIFTLEDTFQLNQDDASVDEVKIDQKSSVIDTDTTPGEMTIEGFIPLACKEILDVLFPKAVTTAASVTGQDGVVYDMYSYFSTPKDVYVTMLVEDEAKENSLSVAKVKFTGSIPSKDDSGIFGVNLRGTILTNDEATNTQGDFAIGKKHTS